jgi:hypothetical protein
MDCKIIDGKVIIDFWPLIKNFHIHQAITLASTTIDKLKQYCAHAVRLVGDEYATLKGTGIYMNNAYRIHSIYIAYKIAEQIITDKTVFHCAGIDRELLQKFVSCAFENMAIRVIPEYKGIAWKNLKGDIFVVIGDIPDDRRSDIITALKNADQMTKVIFLSSEDHPIFEYKKESLVEYCINIKIHKEATSEDCISPINDETLLFFCKNPEIRDIVANFNLDWELRQSRLKMQATSIKCRQGEQIFLLDNQCDRPIRFGRSIKQAAQYLLRNVIKRRPRGQTGKPGDG